MMGAARLHARIVRYAKRWRGAHDGAYPWPTVREVARGLRVRQADVLDEAEEAPLMLTSFPGPCADGDHFVEVNE